MPKDKTESHARVIAAAKAEFLEKGYEKASMREIGIRAGMTSAGLYRHYASKADMFDDLVQPALHALMAWYREHKSSRYAEIDRDADKSELFSSTMIDLVRDVLYAHEDEFRLLITRAEGTQYADFVHHIVRVAQDDFLEALDYMRAKGMKVMQITREEMHLIMSAYITALLEPFIHHMDREESDRCLRTIEDFFMPGWQKIMGF